MLEGNRGTPREHQKHYTTRIIQTGKFFMDKETLQHLWALRKVNEALITGLETAIFVMDKWDELTQERRQSVIVSLQGLIAQSKEAYGDEPAKH